MIAQARSLGWGAGIGKKSACFDLFSDLLGQFVLTPSTEGLFVEDAEGVVRR